MFVKNHIIVLLLHRWVKEPVTPNRQYCHPIYDMRSKSIVSTTVQFFKPKQYTASREKQAKRWAPTLVSSQNVVALVNVI